VGAGEVVGDRQLHAAGELAHGGLAVDGHAVVGLGADPALAEAGREVVGAV
jgi:hypothetical protein